MAKSRNVFLLLMLIFSALALPLHAQEVSSSMRPIQDAVEAMEVQFVTDSSGDVVGIRTKQCDACSVVSFLPAPEVVYWLNGKKVSVDNAVAESGTGGAVIFDIDTRLVKKVNLIRR